MSMPNFGRWAQYLGGGLGFAGELANLVQGIQNTEYENEQKKQGLATLTGLAPDVAAAQIGQSIFQREQNRLDQEAGIGRRSANLSAFAGNYFGTGTTGRSGSYTPQNQELSPLYRRASNLAEDAQQQIERGEAINTGQLTPANLEADVRFESGNTDAALDQLRQDLAKIKLGEGGLSEATGKLTSESLAALKADEAARLGDISARLEKTRGEITAEHDQVVGKAEQNYKDIVGDIKKTFGEFTGMVKEGLAFTRQNFTDAIASIRDTAAQNVASAAGNLAVKAREVIGALEKQLTGDPTKDQMVQRQIAAAKAKLSTETGELVGAARKEASNFVTTARLTANATAQNSIDALTSSYGTVSGVYGNNLNNAEATRAQAVQNAYATLTTGRITLDETYATASNASGQYLAQAGIAAMSLRGAALIYDADKLTQCYDGLDALTGQATADAVDRNNALGAGVASAIANFGEITSAAALAQMGVDLSQVDFSAPGDFLTSWGVTEREQNRADFETRLLGRQIDQQAWQGPLNSLLSGGMNITTPTKTASSAKPTNPWGEWTPQAPFGLPV